MTEQTPLQKINQRRRQMHVHSVIYYHLDDSLISDADFDKWALELVQLQAEHPESLSVGYRPDLFHDWTGDTGMHLPADPATLGRARWLIKYARSGEQPTLAEANDLLEEVRKRYDPTLPEL